MAHVNSNLESGALSPFFVHVAQIATLATESLSTMSRNSTLVKFRVENDGQCASTACFNVQNTYKHLENRPSKTHRHSARRGLRRRDSTNT